MALRLIEATIPSANPEGVLSLLEQQQVLNTWQLPLKDGRVLLRILLQSEQAEAVTDILNGYYCNTEDFRIVVVPVEATLPKLEEPQEPMADEATAEPGKEPKVFAQRISRDELYSDISDSVKVSWVYMIMVILSALVAAIGLLRGDIVIIIGAMVIAPLLGPNVALALASTLGDLQLVSRSLKAMATGFILAVIVSLVIGFAFDVDTTIPAISSRTMIGIGDIVLALAAGSAGALAFNTGIPTALIGVMVATALLPALVNSGLLAGSGNAGMALGSLLLFITNTVCVNLAGVFTFMAQGIRPRTWWQAEKAKKATRIAIVFWVAMLSILILIILLHWLE
jgi:uncharacterized hydrophobic protein (TIGR00341 family)